MKQLDAGVISNSEFLSYPGATYFLLRINAPEIAADSRPGQFCMLKCGSDSLLRRPLSIHAVTPSGQVAFLYDVKGKGTHWLSKMAVGTKLDIIGPLGNGFIIEKSTSNVLLAAGGIGIAPLIFLAQKAVSRDIGVTLIAGARFKEGLYPDSLLPPGMDVIRVVESLEIGTRFSQGKVTDIIPAYLEGVDQVFACGPQAMLEAIGNYVDNRTVTKPVQVSLEVRMGCGSGTCYGCSIKTTQGMQRVCKEGPVFNIKDIIWQEVTI